MKNATAKKTSDCYDVRFAAGQWWWTGVNEFEGQLCDHGYSLLCDLHTNAKKVLKLKNVAQG